MKQIRQGVFETNSSSMHSLAIYNENEYLTHDDMLESLWLDKKGVWDMGEDCYFGRSPFRLLTTFDDKVKYAYANDMEEVLDMVKELVPEVKSINKPEWRGVDDYQLKPWLEKHDIDLKEFITNSKYIIIQDGDEYQYWNKLKNSNLLNLKAFHGSATEEEEYGII